MVRIAVGAAFGLSMAVSLGTGARAETQDAGLEPRLRAWIAGVTGLSIPELPLSITPEGDHDHVAVPVPGLVVPTGEPDVTATLRALDGGRWAVDHLMLPPSSRFTMPVPTPGAPGRTVPGRAQLELAGQDGHMLIDPSFATPTTFSSEVRSVTLEVSGGSQRQLQRIDRYEAHGTLADAGNNRLDLVQELVGCGLADGGAAESERAVCRRGTVDHR